MYTWFSGIPLPGHRVEGFLYKSSSKGHIPNGAVGIDIYSKSLGIGRTVRLLEHFSVFQAEVSVTQAAVVTTCQCLT